MSVTDQELNERLEALAIGGMGEPTISGDRVHGLTAHNSLLERIINLVHALFDARKREVRWVTTTAQLDRYEAIAYLIADLLNARNGIAGGMAASVVIGGGNIGPRSREREIDQADMKREWTGDNQRDLRGLNQQLQVKIELLEEERRKLLTMIKAEEEPEWLQEAERDVERRRRSSTEGSAAESSSPEESIHSPVTVQRPRSSRSALVEEVAAQKIQAAAVRAVAARVRCTLGFLTKSAGK